MTESNLPDTVHDEEDAASPLDKLSRTERAFLLEYIRLGHQTNAWMALRPKTATRRSAEVQASRCMRGIKQKIGEKAIWELCGLSQVEIAKAIREGMNATYVKHMVVPRKGGGARLVECPPVPDQQARLRAAELASKNLGLQAPEQKGPESGKVIVQIVNYAAGGDGEKSHVTVSVPPS